MGTAALGCPFRDLLEGHSDGDVEGSRLQSRRVDRFLERYLESLLPTPSCAFLWVSFQANMKHSSKLLIQ